MKFIFRIISFFKRKLQKFWIFIILKKENVKIMGQIPFKGIPFIINQGNLIISDNVVINSNYADNPIGGNERSSFWIKKGGEIIVKNGARISNSAFVSESKIVIGKNTYIGGDCKIYDTDFHSLLFEDRIQKPDINIKTSPVVIEDSVFIGTGTIIMKGVTIGKNAVVGAGSVITKNIPDGEIWGGNPAKFIRKLYNNT
jgi:acetyltransferase-like isoleucine patch superfamily enzyme